MYHKAGRIEILAKTEMGIHNSVQHKARTVKLLEHDSVSWLENDSSEAQCSKSVTEQIHCVKITNQKMCVVCIEL